jgi:hypothetical protein
MKKFKWLIIVAVFVIGGLSVLGLLPDKDVDAVKAQPYKITFMVTPSSSGTTFGEAIASYCPGGKWSSGSISGGKTAVWYKGGKSPDGKTSIQWNKSSSGWTVYAIEVDGQPKSTNYINNFFYKAQ